MMTVTQSGVEGDVLKMIVRGFSLDFLEEIRVPEKGLRHDCFQHNKTQQLKRNAGSLFR